jgi:hypothetical protein
MLRPWHMKYLRAFAEVQLRGLPHKHREMARLCGWRSTNASMEALKRLIDLDLAVKESPMLVTMDGRQVWWNGGPKLTEKAWTLLGKRRAA